MDTNFSITVVIIGMLIGAIFTYALLKDEEEN